MDLVTDLVIAISNPDKSVLEKRQIICQKTVEAISHANRVSLWRFDQAVSQIECLMCFSVKDKSYSSGMILSKQDFPDYFDAILNQQVLVASDARNHPATKCFNDAYFEPNDIYSLFDYILLKDFVPNGVICCESVGKQVTWLESDVNLLRRIANMTSMFFEIDD